MLGRNLQMWWHWHMLGHKVLSGTQVRRRGETITVFSQTCICGKRWLWTEK